jgi:hypothetical protein
MSSEPPPQPVSDTFNYSQWNVEQTLTIAGAAYRFLSKRVSDTAFGVISFAQGLQSNLITVYTGTILSIGSVGNTVSLLSPTLGSTVPADTDNSTSIISSAWVNSFWTYVRTQAYSWTGIQTFTNGITTNLLATTTSSTALAIGGNNETGVIYIANSSTRTGSIMIGAKAIFPPSNTITIGSSGVATTNLNGNTVNVGTNATNTTVTIGGSATTATNINKPLLTSTIPADTSNDTSIVSSAWVNNFWTYVKTQTNTFSAVQTFSALPLVSASYAAITGGDTSNTIITASWLNATWLPYLRGLANTWTLLQTFTAGISATLPIRVTYAPSSITVNTMIGYTYQANVTSITVSSTRRCQCVLNGTAGVGAVLPAGVYTVSYMAYLNTTTTGYLAGIVVRAAITNGSTSATGGVINLYGGLQSRVQSTTAPFYISGSTTLILDGTDCVAVGIESTTTNTSNVDIYCQATRIA